MPLCLFTAVRAEVGADPEELVRGDTEDILVEAALISDALAGSAFVVKLSVEFCMVTGVRPVGIEELVWFLWNVPNIKAPPSNVLANNVNQKSGKTLSSFLGGSWASIASHSPSRTGKVWL